MADHFVGLNVALVEALDEPQTTQMAELVEAHVKKPTSLKLTCHFDKLSDL